MCTLFCCVLCAQVRRGAKEWKISWVLSISLNLYFAVSAFFVRLSGLTSYTGFQVRNEGLTVRISGEFRINFFVFFHPSEFGLPWQGYAATNTDFPPIYPLIPEFRNNYTLTPNDLPENGSCTSNQGCYTHDGKDLPLRVIVKMTSDWPYATDDTYVFDPTCSVSAQGPTVLCGFSAYHNREDTQKAAFHCQRCEPKGNEKVHSSVIP